MKTHLSEEVLRHREALITDEYGGIYPVHEAFYICSIQYAADRAAEAFLRVDRAVTTKSDATLTFAAVQEALTYAGALSRFFWPIKTSKLAKARGERLRAAFGLAETSPLRSRRLRNALEHFDEKLDLFLLTDPVGCFFPTPIVDDHALADEAIGNIFKLVDPMSEICVMLGEKFAFRPIRDEVQRILTNAIDMDLRGSRLNQPE